MARHVTRAVRPLRLLRLPVLLRPAESFDDLLSCLGSAVACHRPNCRACLMQPTALLYINSRATPSRLKVSVCCVVRESDQANIWSGGCWPSHANSLYSFCV